MQPGLCCVREDLILEGSRNYSCGRCTPGVSVPLAFAHLNARVNTLMPLKTRVVAGSASSPLASQKNSVENFCPSKQPAQYPNSPVLEVMEP